MRNLRQIILCPLPLAAYLLAGFCVFGIAAHAEDSPPIVRQLPTSPQIPMVKRLPDGQIISITPQEQAPILPRPASSQSAPPREATVSAPPIAQHSAAVRHIDQCLPDALTCVRIRNRSTLSEPLPVTFGLPFKPADIAGHAELAGRDDKGNAVTLQLDERTTYPDGSLRYAIVSATLPTMSPNESRTIAILRKASAPEAIKANASPPIDLKIELSVFSKQVTVVKFGDRQGEKLGIPFQTGEQITLMIGDESFSVTVTPDMSGGNMTPYMHIAQAFVPVINTQSKHYRARWNDANDGYEKLWVSTLAKAESFSIATKYGGRSKISVLPYLTVEKPEIWVASMDAASTGKAWLNGPVAVENDIALPLISQATGQSHPQLSARLHLRRYLQAKAVRADVVLENDWAYEPNPRNYTYDVTIRLNGEAVYNHAEINHTHHSRWHTIIWSQGFDEPEIVYDIPYMLDSRAVPHYDPNLIIPDRAIQNDVLALSKTDTGPLGAAQLMLYMPTTGGRADIGPLPRWAAMYLLTMDPRERTILFANADAGGGIPIHYRDKKTGLPVSLDDHPTMVMGPGRANAHDAFPALVIGDTPWTPQIAHHPSLFYLPYLLSGDLFYLEEITYWANWVLASVDPGYRDGAKGLIAANEVRGQAWSLRTLAEAAVIVPDDHPMKSYFSERLQTNIAWYIKRFVTNTNPEQSPVLGIIPKPDDPGLMSPWQQDYLFMVTGHMVEMGIPGARDVLRWLARFSISRWTSDNAGFCHQMAPAYYIKIWDADRHYVRTLNELFRLNWPDAKTCPAAFLFGDPVSAGGYVANAHAALALAVDDHIQGADQAFARLRAEAPQILEAFSDNPTFAIVPRIQTRAKD